MEFPQFYFIWSPLYLDVMKDFPELNVTLTITISILLQYVLSFYITKVVLYDTCESIVSRISCRLHLLHKAFSKKIIILRYCIVRVFLTVAWCAMVHALQTEWIKSIVCIITPLFVVLFFYPTISLKFSCYFLCCCLLLCQRFPALFHLRPGVITRITSSHNFVMLKPHAANPSPLSRPHLFFSGPQDWEQMCLGLG